jgi:pyruvate dehydrogenase E1 component beta subunit
VTELRYWQAINTALAEELERDESVCMLGEDIGRAGGPFGSTRGLFDRFGGGRIWDTPISELGLAAVGTGAAMVGVRPVVEIMYMDFLPLASDQLVNHAAKMRFMSGGRYAVPLTVLTMVAAKTQSGPQHSQSYETWFAQIPGLRVVWPSNPADAKGLLKTAIRSDDPVVVMESLALWRTKGEVPDGDTLVPLGVARVARTGRDVTIVAVGAAVATALRAADQLDQHGIAAEVVDLRSLSPIDDHTVVESVARTGALAVVQDGPEPFGVGRHVVSTVALHDPTLFRHRPVVLTTPFSPTPFAPELEAAFYPDAGEVCGAVRRMLDGAA